MRFLASLTFVLGTACFAPTERDGALLCSSSGGCPSGFECNAPDWRCYREPPGGDPDASPDAPDSGDPPDGRPDGSEFMPECSDGVDNDCDGQIDFGNDPGCIDGNDPNEHGMKQCDDGIDNDGDGATDFQFGAGCGTSDPQCMSPDDNREDM